jgi:hypothetical protein
MSPEVVPEFLPVDGFRFLMGFNISIPPICSGSNQLMRYKQNPLSVGTLDDLQLLLNVLPPIAIIHWLNGVRECWRLCLLELSKPITLLQLWRLLLTLLLLHVCHSMLHGLQHLGLRDQHLLQCWRWRWVGIIVLVILVGTTVASICIGHLMIVKRFEIEIKVEVIDSKLYASRYNDD